jgi:hypothetical protein
MGTTFWNISDSGFNACNKNARTLSLPYPEIILKRIAGFRAEMLTIFLSGARLFTAEGHFSSCEAAFFGGAPHALPVLRPFLASHYFLPTVQPDVTGAQRSNRSAAVWGDSR